MGMNWYKIAQEFSSKEHLEKANQELKALTTSLESKYPGLELFVYENEYKVKLDMLRVPLEMRHRGIGSEILRVIKEFAQKRNKPLVVHPEAERGYKKKLDSFYRDHGFIPNKGRNRDYRISDPFAATMYYKPPEVSK